MHAQTCFVFIDLNIFDLCVFISMQITVSAGSVPSGGADDDDDDVPELVEDFEAASKTETGE